MVNSTSSPKPGENTWLWLAKLISGVLIFIVLVIHLIVNHFVAPEGLLTYADVVEYFQNPLILAMEGFFLVFVVLHSLTGSRSIFLDLNPQKGLLRVVDLFLSLFGLTAIVYGFWLLFAVANQGAGL